MNYIVESQIDINKTCFCGTNGSGGACSDRTKK